MSIKLLQRLQRHLELIYPEQNCEEIAQRIIDIFWPEPKTNPPQEEPRVAGVDTWSQRSTYLITYGHSIQKEGEHPLKSLENFLEEHVQDFIESVHILPFFPFSSDDGFAVQDYYAVNEKHGDWKDIRRIGKNFRLMSDVVINHASAQGDWFESFKRCEEPYKDFFFTAPADADTSFVIRPRPSELLVPFETKEGIKHVWCTFGPDQVDLNFANPEVLIEFIKIMRHYIDNNVRVFRLDAVAFLWKELGSSCIHLPQTHEIVRLIRTLVDFSLEKVLIITETNVPNHENLSYFGNQNEAHLIYNFTLPPLLIQSLLTGNEYYLKKWMMCMPPTQDGCAYFNFTASHDGIGLRPADGILMDEDLQEMIDTIRGFGGEVSMRAVPGGLERPYEMNISFFDALKGTVEGEDRYQRDRFLASQTIMMALAGVPAFYIHSLLATPNDYDKFEKTGRRRAINRHEWDWEDLNAKLSDPQSDQFYILNEIKRIAKIRIRQRAFHPIATQFTMQLPEGMIGVWRQSLDRKQDIFCITNLTKEHQELPLNTLNLFVGPEWFDLLTDENYTNRDDEIFLRPYQTVWITNI